MVHERLNDVFPDWLIGGGIFSALQNLPVPWANEDIATSLDIEYHGNHSGDKIISPLVKKLKIGSVLSDVDISMLALSIYSIYGLSWGKLWDTLNLEYNPIENYNMVETYDSDGETETVRDYEDSRTVNNTITETRTETKTGTDTLTDDEEHTKTGSDMRTDNLRHGKTGTETHTDDLEETVTPNLTTTSDNKIFGFNSSTAVDSDTNTQQATGNTIKENTGDKTITYALNETDGGFTTTQYNTTDATTGTHETEYDTTNETSATRTETALNNGTIDYTDNETKTASHTLTRTGNIGVTTSQQMLESERNIWMWNIFRDVVFRDVDTILTIQTY